MPGTYRSGGRPNPASIRALRGSRTRPRHRGEPVYALGIPEMPVSVAEDEIASARWQVLAARLGGVGVLTEAHGEMLALLCATWADLERARAQFRAMGYAPLITERVMTATGEVVERAKINPLASRIEKLAYQVARFLAEFGLTPMSSAKVVSAKQENSGDDPFAAFLSPQ